MPQKLYINAEDIAAANIGFSLVQAALDMLVRNKIVQSSEVLSLVNDMIKFYEASGKNPARSEIRASAAAALKGIAAKYDVPPINKQN